MTPVDLSRYSINAYKPGGSLRIALWMLVNIIFFKSSLPYPYSFKTWLLRILGARVGRGVVIKPSVSIKYPWFLEVGDHVWIGEGVWIDNLDKVTIGNNVCISQGAMLLCGNHDYKSTTFDLIVKPINIEDGVWVGAKAVVVQGVTLKEHSVITVGSVITKDTEPFGIYRGNPAEMIRDREIN